MMNLRNVQPCSGNGSGGRGNGRGSIRYTSGCVSKVLKTRQYGSYRQGNYWADTPWDSNAVYGGENGSGFCS
jgi:hypothetical protein